MKKHLLTVFLMVTVFILSGCSSEVSEGLPNDYSHVASEAVTATVVTEPPVTVHKHTYTSNILEATCTAQGYTLYSCACGYSLKKDFTDATGHNYVNGTCSSCGIVDSNANTGSGITVYITPYGECYHYDPDCGGKNSYAVDLDDAQRSRRPCKKCAT